MEYYYARTTTACHEELMNVMDEIKRYESAYNTIVELAECDDCGDALNYRLDVLRDEAFKLDELILCELEGR